MRNVPTFFPMPHKRKNRLKYLRSLKRTRNTLGSGMISWSSRKQRLVADSTCYAEYIVLHESSHEGIFLRQLLDSLDFACRGSTPIHCANDVTARLAEDHVFHSQGKHIRVKFHAIRDCIDHGEIDTESVVRTTSRTS